MLRSAYEVRITKIDYRSTEVQLSFSLARDGGLVPPQVEDRV